ncbi:MAG: hypothetical protein J6T48_06810 [Bacteroidales bacterium]|nr:hypothetical protein [Bacteroidales bacterium]
MKKNIFISLLVVAMGVMALTGCEKSKITMKRQIQGEWICTNPDYTKDGELKLIFEKKNVMVIKTASHLSLFDNKKYSGYDFNGDVLKLCCYDGHDYSFTINLDKDNNTMTLDYLGGVSASPDAPSGFYVFAKQKRE